MFNIIKLFIFIIFKKPVLLLPGFGASKLIKNNIEIWPPNLSFFLFNHDKWTNHMMDKTNVYTLEFGDKKSLDISTIDPNILNIFSLNNNSGDIFQLSDKDYIIIDYYIKDNIKTLVYEWSGGTNTYSNPEYLV